MQAGHPGRQIEAVGPEVQPRRLSRQCRVAAAQHRVDPGQHLPGAGAAADEVVGAQGKTVGQQGFAVGAVGQDQRRIETAATRQPAQAVGQALAKAGAIHQQQVEVLVALRLGKQLGGVEAEHAAPGLFKGGEQRVGKSRVGRSQRHAHGGQSRWGPAMKAGSSGFKPRTTSLGGAPVGGAAHRNKDGGEGVVW